MRLGLGLFLHNSSPPSGGAPVWVPGGAVAFLDFENNRCWTAIDGEVALSTQLINFNGAEIVGGLYTPTAPTVVFQGSSNTYATDPLGFSIAMAGRFTDDFSTIFSLREDAGGEIAVYADAAQGVYVEEGVDFLFAASGQAYTANTDIKFAVTFDPNKLAVSDRGAAAVTQALVPATHWDTWDDLVLSGGSLQSYKSIALYTPPLSDAALQTSSTS